MLVIRMQRTGRKGHAQFRVVVQDSRRTPTSGKVVALIGSYDPHSKTATLNKERAEHFVSHGAQPSPRVVRLLKSEGIKLPKWVELPDTKQKSAIKNLEKLRRNRPPEPKEEVASEATPEATSEPTTEETAAEPAESTAEESQPAEA